MAGLVGLWVRQPGYGSRAERPFGDARPPLARRPPPLTPSDKGPFDVTLRGSRPWGMLAPLPLPHAHPSVFFPCAQRFTCELSLGSLSNHRGRVTRIPSAP